MPAPPPTLWTVPSRYRVLWYIAKNRSANPQAKTTVKRGFKSMTWRSSNIARRPVRKGEKHSRLRSTSGTPTGTFKKQSVERSDRMEATSDKPYKQSMAQRRRRRQPQSKSAEEKEEEKRPDNRKSSSHQVWELGVSHMIPLQVHHQHHVRRRGYFGCGQSPAET